MAKLTEIMQLYRALYLNLYRQYMHVLIHDKCLSVVVCQAQAQRG